MLIQNKLYLLQKREQKNTFFSIFFKSKADTFAEKVGCVPILSESSLTILEPASVSVSLKYMYWVLLWLCQNACYHRYFCCLWWVLANIWQKYHPSRLKRNFRHMGGISLILVSPPTDVHVRIFWRSYSDTS